MVLVEPVQIFLILPKVIEFTLFSLIIQRETYKYKGVPWGERSQIHKLFLVGSIGWTTFLFLDIFIFLLAGVSFNPNSVSGNYEGYDVHNVSLLWANILRDISTIGFLVLLWCNFIISYNIKYGEERTSQIFFNKPSYAIMASSLILVFFETVEVSIKSGTIIVDAVWTGLAGLSVTIVTIVYLTAILRLEILLRNSKQNLSENYIKQIRYVIRGLALIGYGLLFLFIAGLLKNVFPDIFSNQEARFIVQFVGHLLWTLSPIYILRGIALPLEIVNPSLRDYRHIGIRDFSSYIDNSILGYYLILNGELVYTNEPLSDLFGTSYKEMSTWSISDFEEFVHADDLRNYKNFINRLLEAENTSDFETFSYRLNVEGFVKWIRQISNPQIIGKNLLIQSFIFDVTKEIELAKELEETEVKYDQIFENVSDLIFTLEIDGSIVSANPAFTSIFGLDPDFEKPLYFQNLILHSEKDEFKSKFEEIINANFSMNKFTVKCLVAEGFEATIEALTTKNIVGKRMIIHVIGRIL